jgi:hypothetical protein
MSNLLSTTAMVADCQSRVPIGLDSTFWMKKLNEAYRWICQKGNFLWELRRADLNVAPFANSFPLPADINPGKPLYLLGPVPQMDPTAPTMESLVPYVPWETAWMQRQSELPTTFGAVSCWSMRPTFTVGPPPVYTYTGYTFPLDVINAASTFTLIYHADVSSTEFTAAATQFFPTPNIFDNLLIELAEAEAKRIYGIAGWDIVQKRAESAIVSLLDPYRSTKNAVAGMADQQKQTGEKKLMGQENS